MFAKIIKSVLLHAVNNNPLPDVIANQPSYDVNQAILLILPDNLVFILSFIRKGGGARERESSCIEKVIDLLRRL